MAVGINSSGQIVGSSTYTRSNSDTYHAFLYSSTTMQDLGDLDGGSSYSYASAINDSGQVVGYSEASDGNYHAFLFSSSTSMQNLDTLALSGSTYSYASDINNSGTIVGYGEVSGGLYAAFVYANNTLQNLNNITSGLNGLTLYDADRVTTNGLILAEGADSSGGYHLIVLTPISAETRAKRPVLVGPHARGVSKARLPKWLTNRPPFTRALPTRLHGK